LRGKSWALEAAENEGRQRIRKTPLVLILLCFISSSSVLSFSRGGGRGRGWRGRRGGARVDGIVIETFQKEGSCQHLQSCLQVNKKPLMYAMLLLWRDVAMFVITKYEALASNLLRPK